jgi:hypothetical protein
MLLVGPIADELEHASPPVIGWVVALLAAGVVLAVDALSKRRRRPPQRVTFGPIRLAQGRRR